MQDALSLPAETHLAPKEANVTYVIRLKTLERKVQANTLL